MSPIKRLEQEADFPRIGELRKGAPKPNDKQPGRDLGEHFRFTSNDAAVLAAFRAVYGDEPASVRVFLPFRTANENLSAWQEELVAGGLVHRCDGETCVLWLDKKTGKYHHEPKPCPGGCKQVGRLSVVIPELRRLAYVTVLTTSIHDIINLTKHLRAYEGLRGDLRGIPFVLYRTKSKIPTPGTDGKRTRREKWLLAIMPQPQWVDLQLTAQEVAAMPQLTAGPTSGQVVVDGRTGEILDEHSPGGPDWGSGAPEWEDEAEEGETINGNGKANGAKSAPPASTGPAHPAELAPEDSDAGQPTVIPAPPDPLPTDPTRMLAAVNQAIGPDEQGRFYYQHMMHALNTLGLKTWPAARAVDEWADVWNKLMHHGIEKRAERQAEQQPEALTEPLPQM
jgi:hypothetical protein